MILANLTSAVFAGVVSIVIARTLGPGLYGVYTLSLIIPTILQFIVASGVTSAITRYAAYYLSIGDSESAKRITLHGIILLLLLSALIALVNLVLSGPVAVFLFHRQELTLYIEVASLLILGQTVLQAAVAAYTGWSLFTHAGALLALQSALRLLLVAGLLVAGFGITGAVLGLSSSLLIVGVAGIALFSFVMLRGTGPATANFLADSRLILSFGGPLAVGNTLSFIAPQYVVVLIAAVASNQVVGYYEAAANLTALITLTLSSFSSTLLPAFSSLKSRQASVAFARTVRYTAFLTTPLALFMAAVPGALLSTVYGAAFSVTGDYLVLLSASFLPVCIGMAVLPPFLTGAGHPNSAAVANTAAALVVFVGAPVLAVRSLVFGPIYSLILSNIVLTVVGLALANRLSARVDAKSCLSVLVSSLLSFAGTALLPFNRLDAPVALLLDAGVFLMLYLTLAALLRALEVEDIDRLGAALGDLGGLSALFRPFLAYFKLVAGLFR